MKKIPLLLIGLIGLTTPLPLLAVNDVGPFYVSFKEVRHNQTDTSAPALSINPYRFSTFIPQASGGTLTGGSVTPPNTGSVTTPQPLVANNDGIGSFSFGQKYTTLAATRGRTLERFDACKGGNRLRRPDRRYYHHRL